MSERYTSYRSFWVHYLGEHRRPATRALHYAGTLIGSAFIGLAAAASEPWWLLAVPVAGYGFAWAAHAFVECNRPATLRYPLWSLIGDLHMTWLFATGRLRSELDRHGIR